MNWVFAFSAAFFTLYAIWGLKSGIVHGKFFDATRHDKPGLYWTYILFAASMAALSLVASITNLTPA